MIHRDITNRRELSLDEKEIELITEFANNIKTSDSVKVRTNEERMKAILNGFKRG